MLFSIFLAVAMACTGRVNSGEDRRLDKSTLRVAGYNAYWLFTRDFEYAPWRSTTEAQSHVKDVAKRIKQMNADIVLLSEVEDCVALDALLDAVQDDTYKAFFVQGEDSATGQDVALLSRVDPTWVRMSKARGDFPVQGNKCGSNQRGSTGVSKNIEALFEVDGMPSFVLIGVHLLSQPTDPDRCTRREGQALVLSDMVANAWQDGHEVIVLGDFNDFDGQVEDASGSEPNSRTLEIVKGGADPPLINTASKVTKSKRYSHCSGCKSPRCSQIDHLLASEGLVALADDIEGDWTENRNRGCRYDQLGGSDHIPVVLTMRPRTCPVGSAGCSCVTACNSDSLSCRNRRCVYEGSACAARRKRAEEGSPLLITGLIDGSLSGGLPKGIELTATRAVNVGGWGLAMAANGKGFSQSQFTFPDVDLVKGEVIYVADGGNDAFSQFFGFTPTYSSSGLAFNGDDALGLYDPDGNQMDLFGEPVWAGPAPAWKHIDGYAQRVCWSGPDVAPGGFDPDEWTIMSKQYSTSVGANSEAKDPFPLRSFNVVMDVCGGAVVVNEPETPDVPAPTAPEVCVCEENTPGCGCTSNVCSGEGFTCGDVGTKGKRCVHAEGLMPVTKVRGLEIDGASHVLPGLLLTFLVSILA